MNILIKEVSIEDAEELHELALETLTDTYGKFNKLEDLHDYYNKSFNIEHLIEEINNKDSEFYFIYSNNNLAGFMKINQYNAQNCNKYENSMQIEHLYIRTRYKGLRFGSRLMDLAHDLANKENNSSLWISVIAKSDAAKAFVTKYNFKEISSCDLLIGKENCKKLIFNKNLN